jgi:hypothetical protein
MGTDFRFLSFIQARGYKRTAFFWVITQRIVIIFTDASGQLIGPILNGQEFKKKADQTGY